MGCGRVGFLRKVQRASYGAKVGAAGCITTWAGHGPARGSRGLGDEDEDGDGDGNGGVMQGAWGVWVGWGGVGWRCPSKNRSRPHSFPTFSPVKVHVATLREGEIRVRVRGWVSACVDGVGVW